VTRNVAGIFVFLKEEMVGIYRVYSKTIYAVNTCLNEM